ncbi:hypothetical protein ACHAXA_000214 [Cyclostephanos tholiformis]|uniref:Uncharacterized protein n=1 Tax=Cyclostephanos tholiformis TaxID=382380 RepID=A0ABD3R3F6_9STRA
MKKSKKEAKKKSKYNDRVHHDEHYDNYYNLEEEEEAELQSNDKKDNGDGEDHVEEEEIEEDTEDEDVYLPLSQMGSSARNERRRRRKEAHHLHPPLPMTKAQEWRIDGNGHSNNHRHATLPSSENAAWRRNGQWKATTTLLTAKKMKVEEISRGGEVGGKNGRKRIDDRDDNDHVSDGDGENVDNIVQGTRGVGNTRKKRNRTRDWDRLFRHRLLLPVNFDRVCPPQDCGCGDVDADFGKNTDAVDVSFEGTTALTTTENDEQCNMWDLLGDVVDEDLIEIDVADLDEKDAEFPRSDGDDGRLGRQSQRRMKVQSRCLPYSDDELYFVGRQQEVMDVGNKDAIVVTGSGSYSTATKSRETRSLNSLRGRIEAANVVVQSRAPSYIEFRAKVWHPELSSYPSLPGICNDDDVSTPTDDRAPSISCTSAIDYQSQRTFVMIPPRSKPHASSRSAQEFLKALQSAAVEAYASVAAERLTGNESGLDMIGDNNKNGNLNTEPSVVVMEFLAIIRESRERPQMSPFHLMKKVWTLIALIASRCKDGEKLGRDLAAKFDEFLPDGYSMTSSNLLLLKGIPRTCTATKGIDGDPDLVKGCARTEEIFHSVLNTNSKSPSNE